MVAFLLGVMLLLPPGDAPPDRDDCVDLLPATHSDALPIGSLSEAQRAWASGLPVPPDTLRARLDELRAARQCFLHLPPAEVERPYLDPLYTYWWAAYLHAGRRQFARAFGAFDQGLSHLDKDLRPSDSARLLRRRKRFGLHQDKGYLHFLLGDLSSAIEQYLRAHEVAPETDLGRRAEVLINIGILHQRVRDYRSARYYYRRADTLLQDRSLGPDTLVEQRVRLLNTRADLRLDRREESSAPQNAIQRANALARRARELAESGTEPHARALSLLSEGLGRQGQFEAAYRLNETARRLARTHDYTRFRTLALLQRGMLHVRTQRWARADSVLTQSLALGRRLGDLDYQRRARYALGHLHELTGNWAEAEHHYREGVAVIEQYRASLTASQWSVTAFGEWRDMHRGLVRALLAQGQDQTALAALDRSRARHLQDLRTQGRIVDELPPQQRARFDSLTQALSEVRTRMSKGPDEAARRTALRTREGKLMAARQRLLDLPLAPERRSPGTIKATVRRQERALVSYFLDDPAPTYDRSARSVAFVLTADTLRTVPLPGLTQDSVRTLTGRISPLLGTRDRPVGLNAMHFDLRPLHALQEALYAPVAKHLPAQQPLTVVPDGPLFRVPFSALVRRMPGGRFAPAEARYVLHERPIATELAASLVADTARTALDRPSEGPALSAFGVSDFDTLRPVPSALRAVLPSVADSVATLPSLPGVRSELRTVGRLVGDATVTLNEGATEAAVRSACRRAGVVHLASHAVVHPSVPLRNAFLLRPDTTDGTDGVFFLHELRAQERRIPLVVLSGCGTARGLMRGGEGMAGLQYGFRAAGAQATVSSLWPVADRASVALTEQFYRRLRAGAPKDEALRRAKLAYLDNHPEKASPFFWASSVLYGSPRPLSLSAPSTLPAWVWGAMGVGAGAVVMLFWAWRTGRLRRSSLRPGAFR